MCPTLSMAQVSTWMFDRRSFSAPDSATSAKTACIKTSHNPDQLCSECQASDTATSFLSLHPTTPTRQLQASIASLTLVFVPL